MKSIAMILGCATVVLAQDSTETLEKHKIKDDMKAEMKEMIGTEIRGIAGQTFAFVGGQMFNGSPVKGQPYSAEAVNETTQTLADGNKIVTRSSTMIYRDSEGRERREETIGRLAAFGKSGTAAKVVFISDPVAKVSYTLHAEDHTAEKMPALAMITKDTSTHAVTTQSYAFTVRRDDAAGAPEPPKAPFFFESDGRGGHAESAGKVEQLGMQTVEGVAAEGTRTTTTIPAGQIGNERDINIVSERWVSPDLGVLVMSKRSDPRMGETVYKLTNVNRSEPAHALFEVPADYTVSDAGRPVILNKEEQ
jgi:hypothetical protein